MFKIKFLVVSILFFWPAEDNFLWSEHLGPESVDALEIPNSKILGAEEINGEVIELNKENHSNQINHIMKTVLTMSLETDMVSVQGGTFTMGCTGVEGQECDDAEKPAHQVTLTSFKISKYEVTQGQWRAVMWTSPSYFKDCDTCPVEMVSWSDIQVFLSRLKIITGKDYRLPTEAEWEFAARGGIKSKGYAYSGSNSIHMVALYSNNNFSGSQPVGQKLPNELGLYDMSGNVWEWTNDWFGAYTADPQVNPRGPSLGDRRVLRGCGYGMDEKGCRISKRLSDTPDAYGFTLGFRIAISD